METIVNNEFDFAWEEDGSSEVGAQTKELINQTEVFLDRNHDETLELLADRAESRWRKIGLWVLDGLKAASPYYFSINQAPCYPIARKLS